MSLRARAAVPLAVLPLLALLLAGCGEGHAGSDAPSAPGASGTRVPPTGPEVSVGPDWARTVDRTGYPVMPTG